MNKILPYLLASTLYVFIASCSIKHPTQENIIGNDKGLDDFIASTEFIGVALVKKGDSYILKKPYGYADFETKRLNTLDTRFPIGSITKVFTSQAIIQLKTEKKIESYEDKLSKYIGNYPRGNEITIQHLLSHRTGIPNYVSLVERYGEPHSPETLLNLIRNRVLKYTPGEKYDYSNSNFLLLGYLIELVSGINYGEYLHENIFLPAKLKHTEYGQNSLEVNKYAIGYGNSEQSSVIKLMHESIPYAAGAIISTAPDLEVWVEYLQQHSFNSEKDLNDLFPTDNEGFGWGVSYLDGKKFYGHDGGIGGFSSRIAIFPDSQGVIILLSNVRGKFDQFQKIINYISNQYY